MCVCAKSLQLCLTLCDPMDCSPPGSSVHGTLQARILEWVAMPFSRGLSWPRIEPTSLMSPALAGEFFTASTTWEAQLIRTYCIQHRELYSTLIWWPKWKGNPGKRGYMYMYSWFTLLDSRNWHNTAKQLYSNKKEKPMQIKENIKINRPPLYKHEEASALTDPVQSFWDKYSEHNCFPCSLYSSYW